MVRKWSPKKRVAILSLAEREGVTVAGKKYGVNTSLIYKWRAAAAKKAANGADAKPAARVRSKTKRAAKKSRVLTTDAQKRVILRDAVETSVPQAAAKYGVSTASIYEWRKKFRPARSKVAKSTRARKRKAAAKSGNGHAMVHEGTTPLRTAHELNQLRDEVARLVDENQVLKNKLIQYVIRE